MQSAAKLHVRVATRSMLWLRDGLLVVLSFISGWLDALAYLGLGNVFIANMTGNTVLLGISLGHTDFIEALRNGIAFIAFALGTLLGAGLAGRGRPRGLWPLRVTLTLGTEVGLLGLFATGWWLTGGQPQDGALRLLEAAGAAAMGLQSAAVRRLSVSGVSTTYVTGTLATLMGELALTHDPERPVRHAGVIGAMCGGAVLGALTFFAARRAAVLAPPVLLLLVLVVAWIRFRGIGLSLPVTSET